MKRIFIPAAGLWLLASPFAHALTDTNSNGLSDDWEKTYNNGQLFSSANPDHDPAADPDGDDWDNLREATAGTDPFDPLPPLGILAPAIGITPATFEPLPEGSEIPSPQQILLDPAEIRLTWPTVPGKTYQTFLSSDLLTWAPASGSYVGSGIHITTESEALYEDGTIPEKLFWRVEAGDTDRDGDTISDYEEILRGLNPLSVDTDGDGIPDNLDPAPLVNSLQAIWDADSVNPSSAPLFAAFSFTPPATGVYPFTVERVTDNSGNSRHGKARTQFGTTPSEQNTPQANAEGTFTNITDPAQTKFLLLDPYNADTKAVAADGTKLIAPETPWGSIGEGQDARPAYYEKIEPMRVVILPLGITPDANRDGKIDLADRDKITPAKPWRFWANDDDDSGDTGGSDIPQTPGAPETNGYDHRVNGVRDLIDFFPLDLNLKAALEIFPQGKYRYKLTHAAPQSAPCFKIVQARTQTPATAGHYLKDLDTATATEGLECLPIHSPGRHLDARYLDAQEQGEGILLVEAVRPTTAPIKLAIIRRSDQAVMGEVSLPVSVTTVEKMFRHKNLRQVTGGEGGAADRAVATGYPDEYSSDDWFVMLHGYNVNGEKARGWQTETFKRFFWSGSRAKFVGVSWFGEESEFLGLGTPKYYVNVENGLLTSSHLAAYVNGLQGGRKFLMGHSLGCLVTADAMANKGMNIEKAFLVNAALPTESLLPKAFISNDPHMEPSPWRPYSETIKSSEWYRLFPAADSRSRLTWRGLFHGAVPKLKMFHSPGEEVLTAFPLDFAADPGIAVEDPIGSYAFALQAMLKGMLGSEPDTVQEGLGPKFISLLTHAFEGLSPASDTGGWAINGSPDGGSEAYNVQIPDTTNYAYRAPAWFESRVALPAFKERLRSDPAFSTNLPEGCDGLYVAAQGSQVAATPWKFNRILAQMIPERSLPAGGAGGNGIAGGVVLSLEDKYSLATGDVIQTYDMQANRNGWPASRPLQFGNGWRHSDLRNVAYLYTWKTLQQIVNDGNLDDE